MTSRENKFSWKNDERWFLENKVTRIISVLQYLKLSFYYASGPNDREHIVFVLSVCLSLCLSVVNFNLRYNFWTVKDRDFIFGMHTPLMMPFQMAPRSMTLSPWLRPWSYGKNSFFDFVAAGAYCSVSQTPLDFLCPRHKMARGHFVFALSVIPSFRRIKVCLLNSSYILAWIWMKLGTDVVPQVLICMWGVIHVRQILTELYNGPWHLVFKHILACLLNSSYILAWIWMKLGRDVAPQV